MRDYRVAAMTTRFGDSLSRRASLLGLGGAALTAVAGAALARAGKAGKKAKKTCKKQIGQCESSVATFCAEAPSIEEIEECEAALLPCCASFKGCKAGTAYGCLVDALLELFASEPE